MHVDAVVPRAHRPVCIRAGVDDFSVRADEVVVANIEVVRGEVVAPALMVSIHEIELLGMEGGGDIRVVDNDVSRYGEDVMSRSGPTRTCYWLLSSPKKSGLVVSVTGGDAVFFGSQSYSALPEKLVMYSLRIWSRFVQEVSLLIRHEA